MKTGKYIQLGEYNNVKIGYGTVDFKNLKTIYLKLNSWLLPMNETEDFELIIFRTRRVIKEIVSKFNDKNFKSICIVDLDVRTKGLKMNKKSFMNLEVTLYVENQFDIKSKDIKESLKILMKLIIDNGLSDKKLFNFNKTKK
jgi:hypothetical protein